MLLHEIRWYDHSSYWVQAEFAPNFSIYRCIQPLRTANHDFAIGDYVISAHGGLYYDNLDAITAQAIVFEMLKENNDAA